MRYLFAILIFALSPAASAIPISPLSIGLFNTGVDNTGVPLLDGTVDGHYAITFPSALPAFARTSAGGFPIPPWLPDNATSAWVSPTTGSSNAPNVYSFQTTFDLTGFDHTTAVITGQWSTDNPGLDIRINGNPTGHTTPFNAFGIGFFAFSLNSGFVAGVNTLDFIVNDTGVIGGLRVEYLSVNAGEIGGSIPEPTTLALLGLGLAGLGFARRHTIRLVSHDL